MRNAILILMVLILSGCNENDNNKKVNELEQRIQQLENNQKSTGNWILWKRNQSYCPNCMYSAPGAISAFSTRPECYDAISKAIDPGGKTITVDPVETEYKGYSVTFYCLPPSVQAGTK